jgi:iron complex outermembrane receptor protein
MYSKTLHYLLSVCLLFISVNVFAQQPASVSGTVLLADNQPASNATVVIKGTSLGTTTNSAGQYLISNIKPGTYTIRVSSIGLTTRERNLVVRSGDQLVENFQMEASSEQLQVVEVTSNHVNPFARKESAVVAKMPLKNIENPQVYSTISSELLREQVVTNFDDALKNAPGLTQLWASTGRGGDGAGYYSLRGFPVQPTMVNGLPGLSNGNLDPSNIERIEVIKGPSGTLFGSSLISYGGLININTKRPYELFGGELSYSGGSYGLNRVTADVNVPLHSQEQIAMRVNTAYHSEDSFQDAGFRKSFFFAPSFSYKVNDKLSFFVNTEFLKSEQTNPTMLFFDRGAPLTVRTPDELGYNNKRSYTSNQLALSTPSFSMQSQMNYKISEEWTSQTVYSRSNSKSHGYYSYLYEGTQYYPDITQGTVFNRWMNYQDAVSQTTDIQQNFIGDFKIGNLRNRVVAGLDYYTRTNTDNGSGYIGNGAVYIGNDPLDIVNNNVYGINDPIQFITSGDSGNLTAAGTDQLLASAPINSSKVRQEVFSAYISDVLNITPAFSVMASLRADRFVNHGDVSTDTYEAQTAFSPKFGIIYQPVLNRISLFANYMNGFVNTAPATNITSAGTEIRTFGPEQANQFEAGTKISLMNDRLYAVLSYYNIQVKDMVYTLYGAGTQESFNNGAQRNTGFEAEFVANPVIGLNIVAGYSYSDSILNDGDTDFIGHRPESAGARNSANLWASYRFSTPLLNGFGLGFGGNYSGENKIMNRTIPGAFTLPEYTVLNASVSYQAPHYMLTLKVDNLTNAETFDGWSTIRPRNMRSVIANLTYRF